MFLSHPSSQKLTPFQEWTRSTKHIKRVLVSKIKSQLSYNVLQDFKGNRFALPNPSTLSARKQSDTSDATTVATASSPRPQRLVTPEALRLARRKRLQFLGYEVNWTEKRFQRLYNQILEFCSFCARTWQGSLHQGREEPMRVFALKLLGLVVENIEEISS